jgi:hypothetical protein
MSKGDMNTESMHEDSSINDLIESIATTMEELKSVIRNLEDLSQLTDERNRDAQRTYEVYSMAKGLLDSHLLLVEKQVERRNYLIEFLASYTDTLRKRKNNNL